MPALSPLDVIVIFDATIVPPGAKMVACIHPENGWFYRINSKGHWRPRVQLKRADHPFLDHDSNLECGDPLELDDFTIDEGLQRHGIIGRISPLVCKGIVQALELSATIKQRDKEAIQALLLP